MNNLQLTVTFDIPDWAKWLAMDQDGSWYAYMSEPYLSTILWDSGIGDPVLLGQTAPKPDWRNELYSLEWEYE